MTIASIVLPHGFAGLTDRRYHRRAGDNDTESEPECEEPCSPTLAPLAVDEGDAPAKLREVYASAVEAGALHHWSEEHPGMMDLHSFSVPLAKAAVRHALDELKKKRCDSGDDSDLVIITGKGRNAALGFSVTQPAVREMLMSECSLPSELVTGNSGRVLVKGAHLSAYLSA